VIVGNKIDVAGDARKVTTREGQELADKWGVPFIETSAKTRVNIEECITEVVRRVYKREEEDTGPEEWFLPTHTNQ